MEIYRWRWRYIDEDGDGGEHCAIAGQLSLTLTQSGLSMSSDLARTIHTIAKHLHAAEQKLVAEQSAAPLIIYQEEEGVYPEEYNNHCSTWDLHKSANGTVQLQVSPAKSVRTSREAPNAEGYKFHSYNQAVGEYLAGQLPTRE